MSYRFTNQPNPPRRVDYVGTCTGKYSPYTTVNYPNTYYVTDESHSIRDLGGKKIWLTSPFGGRFLSWKPVIVESYKVSDYVVGPTSRIDASTSY